MITILWHEYGDRWEQTSKRDAEKLIEELENNPSVNIDDVIIFYENSFESSSTGATFNLPIGTVIKIISEQQLAVITNREMTDIGIKYNIITHNPRTYTFVYDRNIDILKIGNGEIDANWWEIEIR